MRLRIRDLREDRDLTQSQIAKILGCTQQTYSRYESGEITIDIYNLVKKLQTDIYTDVMYPNDKRPTENHGYNTQYKG